MTDNINAEKLARFRAADASLPDKYRLWPLYGAGFENLGKDGRMIEAPQIEPGSDQLLVRHDAVGICFSDIKVIRTGQQHARIYRTMREEPVTLGHEVSLTIVGIGEELRDEYEIGDRFIVQADIYIGGVSYAYGYEIQGGFSEYNIIDQRVLNSDGGNYLIKVKPTTGYAEAALNEPWACVEAAYTVTYRTAWRDGGAVWIKGDGEGASLGAAANWRPAQIVLDVEDAVFATEVRTWADGADVTIIEDDGEMAFDDIVMLSNDPELIESAFPRLANDAAFNVVSSAPLPRRVSLDLGRIHYDNLLIVGTNSSDLSAAYREVRTQLKPGGNTWVLGAAGPMGHMHVQRALEMDGKPGRMIVTNLHEGRMKSTHEKFEPMATAAGVEFYSLSRESFDSSTAMCEDMRGRTGGVNCDDIAIMAPSVAAIELAMDYLAPNGVMNIFAGLPRGTMTDFDYNLIKDDGIRFVGTSGSSIDDLRHMLELTETHALSTNSSVSAVASLEGVDEGLRAVAEGRFTGKVVIYPQIKSLPLTPIEELETILPTVYEKLENGRVWTIEAEEEFLRQTLP